MWVNDSDARTPPPTTGAVRGRDLVGVAAQVLTLHLSNKLQEIEHKDRGVEGEGGAKSGETLLSCGIASGREIDD
eukprot:m.482119 g.482119  ORF g.482119 m.482119 type:complete len:75 (+) comp59141_c0_seq1:92-316(+)